MSELFSTEEDYKEVAKIKYGAGFTDPRGAFGSSLKESFDATYGGTAVPKSPLEPYYSDFKEQTFPITVDGNEMKVEVRTEMNAYRDCLSYYITIQWNTTGKVIVQGTLREAVLQDSGLTTEQFIANIVTKYAKSIVEAL